ncbi:MAG: FmdB family zinc ribbon protein [Actinomycetota bacterium]
MPTYVYRFIDTGETIEVRQSFDDAALTEAPHPSDGKPRPVKKVFTPVGVTFKGSGFYKTDSGSGAKSAKSDGGAATSGAGSGSDAGSGTSSGASSDAGSGGGSSAGTAGGATSGAGAPSSASSSTTSTSNTSSSPKKSD